MTVQLFRVVGASAVCVALLAGCGGGGGDAPATSNPPATTSFALATGYTARIVSGATDNFSISGGCSGTSRISTAAAVASTFEGVAGFSSEQTSTTTLTNCSPATATVTGTTYYNAGYVPIGLAIVGGEYSKFASNVAAFPATVKVGDTGVVSTMTTYTDSSKAVTTGQRVVSYTIEADSTTTVIANVITSSYNPSGQLLVTEKARFRMTESGALTLTLIDVQFTTPSLHLVLTPT